MLVDTHCHLDQFPEPAATLAEAERAGVTRVVAVSEDPASIAAVVRLGERLGPQVLAGVGLHPCWVVRCTPEELERGLQQVAAGLPGASVLGEVGLDHQWAQTAAEQALQERVLERQFELAARCGKPANLHSRRCLRQTMERAIAFHRDTGLNAQLHWFTHSRKLVAECNRAGIYVSVGPTVLEHGPTQEVALAIDDELLLLETDAPVPIRGQPGHPARARAVAETLAALKGVALEELAARTSANFARFLGE
ncbi:MAG: TatD family hydrolase [Candidatus Latescibacterota bacterium]